MGEADGRVFEGLFELVAAGFETDHFVTELGVALGQLLGLVPAPLLLLAQRLELAFDAKQEGARAIAPALGSTCQLERVEVESPVICERIKRLL